MISIFNLYNKYITETIVSLMLRNVFKFTIGNEENRHMINISRKIGDNKYVYLNIHVGS